VLPCRWPDLTDRLLEVAGSGELQIEVVAMVLTTLAEEASCTDIFSNMPPKRRGDVVEVLRCAAIVARSMRAGC
jgi:hypothetical protein